MRQRNKHILKISQYFFVVITLFSCISTAFVSSIAQNNQLPRSVNQRNWEMTVENSTVYAGVHNMIVHVNGTWDETIGGYQICMFYNDTILDINNVSLKDAIAEENGFLIWSVWDVGILNAGALWLDPADYPLPGSGVLFNISVNVIKNIPTQDTLLSLGRISASVKTIYAPESGGQIIPTVNNGTLHIIGNNQPYQPSNPTPSNGTLNVDITTNLSWSGGDPDNDSVVYNLYFGTTPDPPLVALNLDITLYEVANLNYSTQYFWKIVAKDEHFLTTTGPMWTFTTLTLCGDANDDGIINVSDAVFLINYLFIPGSPAPSPLCRGECNGDSILNISDAVYLINHIFVPGFPQIVSNCCDS
jgi:hypothetical protein